MHLLYEEGRVIDHLLRPFARLDRCKFSLQFLLEAKMTVSCLISIPQMHLQQQNFLLIKEVMQFYRQVDVLITTSILLCFLLFLSVECSGGSW